MKLSKKFISTAAAAALVSTAVISVPPTYAAEAAVGVKSVVIDVNGAKVVVDATTYGEILLGLGELKLTEYLYNGQDTPTVAALQIGDKFVDITAYGEQLLLADGDVEAAAAATEAIETTDFSTVEFGEDGKPVLTPIVPEVTETNLTAYNAALAAVTEADYTPESWTAYKEVVDANVVTVENTQDEVDAATAAITAAQASLVKAVKELKVESVSAINATTLTLKGTNLSDLDVTKLVINKKGYASQKLIAQSVTVAENGDATVVLADNTPALTATDYVLSYDGGAVVEFKGDAVKPTFTIEAVDAKTVKVIFSEKVNKAAAENVLNYTITPAINTAGAVPLTANSSASLAADGKTLTISLGTTDFATGLADADYFFVIDNSASTLADLAGNAIANNSAKSFTATATADKTAPTVISAAYSAAAKELTVKFSEQITTTSLDKTKISVTDGTNSVALSTSSVSAWSNTDTTLKLTVTAAEATAIAALGANLTLTIGEKAVADKATTPNYNAKVEGISLAAVAVLNGVTYDEQTNKLTLKFNKAVKVSTLDVTQIALSGTGATGVTLTAAGTTVTTTEDGTTVEITLKDSLANLANWEGASITNRKATLTTGAQFKDVTGTAVGTSSNVDVTYTKDTVKPTLVSATFNKTTNRLTLKFSEKINYAASTLSNLFVTDKDGLNPKALNTTKVESAVDSDTITLIDVTSILTGGAYPEDGSKLYFAKDSLKDLAGNGSEAVASTSPITVTFVDQTGPTVGAAHQTHLGLNQFVLRFSEKVSKQTAENKENYTIALSGNTSQKLTIKSAQLSSNETDVVITTEENATPGYVYNVTVKNIEDKYTNKIVENNTVGGNVSQWTVANSTDTTGPSLAASGAKYKDVDNSKTVTAGDTLTLTFNEPININEVDANDFTLTGTNLGTNPQFKIGANANELEIVLGTGAAINLGTDSINNKVTAHIKDAAGNSAAVGTNSVIAKPDTIAPTIVSAVYSDENKDGSVSANDYVVVTFSEPMDTAANISALAVANFAFQVTDTFGASAYETTWLSPTQLRVKLNGTPVLNGTGSAAGSLDSSTATLDIGTSLANLKDLWGNAAAASTPVKITSEDKTGPKITSVALTDNNTTGVSAGDFLDVTFDEPVHFDGTVDADDFWLSNGGSLGTTGLTVAKVAGSNTTVRITLGAGAGVASGATTINVSAIASNVNIFDASGNKATQSVTGATIPTATTGDTTVPTLSVTSLTATGTTTADITFTPSKAGTAHYVVVAKDATAPTATEIKAGQASGGTPATASGNASVTGGTAKTLAVLTGIAANTEYDAYVVVTDLAGNVSAPVKVGTAKTKLQIAATSTDVALTTGTPPFTALTDGAAQLTVTTGTVKAGLALADLEVTGLPAGLTLSAVKGTGNTVDITVTGTALAPIATGTTFTVKIKASGVTETNAIDSSAATITISQI